MDTFLTTISEIIESKHLLNATKPIVESNCKVYLKTKGKCIIIKTDNLASGTKVNPYFKKDCSLENLHCINDYLIIYPYKSTLFVFVCELKSTIKIGSGGNFSKAKIQIKAGYLIAKYLVESTNRLLDFRYNNIAYRGLMFGGSLSSKQGTNIRNKRPYSQLGPVQYLGVKAGDISIDSYCY
jgi:hypothetical protein